MRRALGSLVLLLVAGCGTDIAITKQAVCDGVLQPGEETPDGPFDVDQDGAFDGANPGCAATYQATLLDCDDADPAVRPGADEVGCNGIDDDCTADTPDGDDVDADGFSACDDCADADATVNPGATEVSCNAVDDDCDAATIDGVDADLDGYTACIDCADADAVVNPGAAEITCNGIDDDCDAGTPDGADLDLDGWTQCDDCDDTSDIAHPSATEACDNGADDDCDGAIDENCLSDYTGTWDLDDTIAYDCAWSNVLIDFDRVLISDDSPDVSVDALGSGIQPGEMAGTFSSATAFSAEQVLRGTCNEFYTLSAEFTSMTTFEATFTAEFTGSCFDCRNQSWTVSGSR